jgi:type I restriction enzyme S subunit
MQMAEWRYTEFGQIPAEWDLKTINEIKSREKYSISMGPFGSNITVDNFISEGVPVIRGVNLNFDRFVDGEFVFVSEEKADQLKSSNCKSGDLVFTHRGTIGQVGLIPFKTKYERYIISQSGMKLTVDSRMVDPLFVFYFFKSRYGQFQLLKNESQVGVPSISTPLTSLKEIEIPVPPLIEQTSIASIFSSLDDKIDLLHRQNKTLEALAETLFMQWFVEETSGLEEKNLDDVCLKIASGGTPSTKVSEYYGGSMNWYSTKELNDNFLFESVSKITEQGLENSSAKLFPENTIVIAIYAAPTVGRLGILGNEASFNQAACGFIADETKVCFEYLYLHLLLSRQKLNDMASGSAQQNLNVGIIKSFPIPLPPKDKMDEFRNQARPLFKKIKSNSIQIRNLNKLRDTLLPKLMSGEVRVEM